jgi:hypothetical protein
VFETAAPIQRPAKCEVRSSYGFPTQKVNVQQKFTNKLLLFMVTFSLQDYLCFIGWLKFCFCHLYFVVIFVLCAFCVIPNFVENQNQHIQVIDLYICIQ